jgi:hypothetical protein
VVKPVEWLHWGLLIAMLTATVLSGLQYCWKAYWILHEG